MKLGLRTVGTLFAIVNLHCSCGEAKRDTPIECVEPTTRECETERGVGVAECIKGYWSTCRVETSCRDGELRDCETQLGECRKATKSCKDGRWGNCSLVPTNEVCDGKDNDCDGEFDEGCPCTTGAERPCGSDLFPCVAGTQTCTSGNWGSCQGAFRPEDSTEKCDGADNDCDGDVDENCDCVDGDEQECGTSLGACEPGVQRCAAGRWGRCQDGSPDRPLVMPEQELCDGADNDCDGDVDEGCDCRDGATLECGSDVGACQHGAQTCTGGKWGNCEGDIGPDQEGCDGSDNDCDGDVDEGCDCVDGDEQECGTSLGACEPGMQRCEAGRWGKCEDASPSKPLVAPQQEICDGVDNDCDGDIDEGCECADGAQRSCGTSLGACEEGLQGCENGKWGNCVGGTGPESEVCDYVDNDCDGDIDEGCECRNGSTRWCNGGEGVCRSGQQTCASGSWGACMPVTGPVDELCDGVDNDCDGSVDEGFDLSTSCPNGGCPQRRQCSEDGLSSRCVNDPHSFAPERCDGIDNDCDGLLDRVHENGSVRSICQCETRTLAIGNAVDTSIPGNVSLCSPTRCGPDRPRGLLIDGICWPGCQTDIDADGDGWGFENGRSCLMPNSPRGLTAAPCDGIPLGMAMTYCLNCSGMPLPFAMCQSLPQFDLRAFGRGEVWLKVNYTFSSSAAARVPVNLWFHGGGGRKRVPLVRVGDTPGRRDALLRAEDACFTPSTDFGSACPGKGQACPHCGSGEVCGALLECGDYDLSQAWLQVAAEFCELGIGNQSGTVTVHSVDAVEPNCGE